MEKEEENRTEVTVKRKHGARLVEGLTKAGEKLAKAAKKERSPALPLRGKFLPQHLTRVRVPLRIAELVRHSLGVWVSTEEAVNRLLLDYLEKLYGEPFTKKLYLAYYNGVLLLPHKAVEKAELKQPPGLRIKIVP